MLGTLTTQQVWTGFDWHLFEQAAPFVLLDSGCACVKTCTTSFGSILRMTQWLRTFVTNVARTSMWRAA